jgi:phage terminase large subunit GpA-like protein
MISNACAAAVYDCLLPRPFVASSEWCAQHLTMTSESKIRGRFRLDLFPHVIEPFEAFDDPEIDVITLQWAAQTAKTTWAQACVAKTAKINPHPMVWAEPDEHSCRRVLKRTWKLFELSPALSPLCPPPTRQSSERIELQTCVIRGAWAGSSTKAADIAAFVVVINEASKIRGRSTDTEADFRLLLRDRATGYVGFKILQMSTPQLKGVCYIEQQRLEGDNRRRMLPCPHCGGYQTLRTGDGKAAGGIRFEKKDGKLDAATARETAWYECEHCRGRIEEHHRREMCQAGLWVPEGCDVSNAKIVGTPARRGRHASFGPLSTLHSLLPGVTIGVCAEEWVKAQTAKERKREAIRHYINSWEGQTWDPAPVEVQPSDVEERMACDDPLRFCPEWARFVTLASDVGWVGDQLLFYWGACCWGLHGRGQLIDLGLAIGREQMLDVIQKAIYPHADGGLPLRPVNAGIDSGAASQLIYEFCNPLPGVTPLKGSSQNDQQPFVRAGFPEMFRFGFQEAGLTQKHIQQKRKISAFDLIHVNTERSQQWLEERLRGMVKRDAANWFSIPRAAFLGGVAGLDLAKHLIGDYQDDRGNWQKRYDEQEYRDTVRYNLVMAYVATANGQLWDKLGARDAAPRRSTSAVASEDGARRSGFVRRPSR